MGLSHTNQEKSGHSYTFFFFFLKRGPIIYLAALKKVAIRHHIRTILYIGSYPPLPPNPHPSRASGNVYSRAGPRRSEDGGGVALTAEGMYRAA